MEQLKKLVHDLSKDSTNRNDQILLLQQINEVILKRYQLSIGNYLFVQPLEVEIFYVNQKSNYPYIDTNMHCMIDPKMQPEIWNLQSARFGQLYYHLKGAGGIDVWLSDSPDYVRCCTLKAARINGKDIWRQTKVRNAIIEHICEHESLESKETLIQRMNSVQSMPVLSCRENPTTEGYVYHIKRQLRRNDKNSSLLLRSFMDIWNKNMPITTVKRVNLYMQAHPTENVLEVMRKQGFHFIPVEIRMKYSIGKNSKL